MNPIYSKVEIMTLFSVKSGDFHAIDELNPGSIPLISCGVSENGFVGYFDIPKSMTFKKAITVAYNGLPLTSKFHPYTFGAKDDVAILIPRKPMRDFTLFYIAALLNMSKWRYSYGRKCYREKLENFTISLPFNQTDLFTLDEDEISRFYSKPFDSYLPRKASLVQTTTTSANWKTFNITDIFNLDRGDFHAIDDLDPGKYMTISRVSSDNGFTGYYECPPKAKVYKRGTITVSTVGGDSFVQLDTFIATDNVIICSPKKKWKTTSLFFICLMLNQQKWRYSYGRQCYKEKLSKVNFTLPVDENGEPDELIMKAFVVNTSYWQIINDRFLVADADNLAD